MAVAPITVGNSTAAVRPDHDCGRGAARSISAPGRGVLVVDQKEHGRVEPRGFEISLGAAPADHYELQVRLVGPGVHTYLGQQGKARPAEGVRENEHHRFARPQDLAQRRPSTFAVCEREGRGRAPGPRAGRGQLRLGFFQLLDAEQQAAIVTQELEGKPRLGRHHHNSYTQADHGNRAQTANPCRGTRPARPPAGDSDKQRQGKERDVAGNRAPANRGTVEIAEAVALRGPPREMASAVAAMKTTSKAAAATPPRWAVLLGNRATAIASSVTNRRRATGNDARSGAPKSVTVRRVRLKSLAFATPDTANTEARSSLLTSRAIPTAAMLPREGHAVQVRCCGSRAQGLETS